MVERMNPALPISQQCRLLALPRSSVYRKPVEVSAEDLAIMALIDRRYLARPYYGSRRMAAWLATQGHRVNRKRVQRLMRLLGLAAIHQRPNTSKPAAAHKIYPYLLRGLAMRRSLCPSSSSIWKHWELVSRHNATRTTCSPNRGGHPILLQVVGADLVGSARHNLLGREDAGFNEAANAVVRNSERRGGLRHRQPFAVLLGRTVGMNAIHPAHRADTVRGPGFSLTGGHSHPVQGRGDVLVRPSGRHGPHHCEGLVGGAAAILTGLRLADPQLRVLAAAPMDCQDDLAGRL